MTKTVINSETAKDYLLVDGYRIVGLPNNREGRRAYERGLRRGKGFMRIAELVKEVGE